MGPYFGQPNAVRLQIRVDCFCRQLSEFRCQAQALKLAFAVDCGIGHAHLLEEMQDRTPSLVSSVVYTTKHTHVFVCCFAQMAVKVLDTASDLALSGVPWSTPKQVSGGNSHTRKLIEPPPL